MAYDSRLIELIKEYSLLESTDRRLQELIRQYSTNPSDENAHAIANYIVRTQGGGIRAAASSDDGPKEVGALQHPDTGRNLANTTVVRNNRYSILVSYDTPVAYKDHRLKRAYVARSAGNGATHRLGGKFGWGRSTNNHIKVFVDRLPWEFTSAQEVQAILDRI